MSPVLLDPAVLTAWARGVSDGLFDVDFCVKTDRPAGDVVNIVRAWVNSEEARVRGFAARAETFGDEPPDFGQWRMIAIGPGTVGVRVYHFQGADLYLPRFAKALEAQGLRGTITGLRWPEVPELPRDEVVIEARMLVRGRRLDRGPGTHFWDPDRDALGDAIDRATRWIAEADATSPVVFTVSDLPAITLEPRDLGVRFKAALETPGIIEARVRTCSEGARVMTWHGNHGQLALISVSAEDWRTGLEDVREPVLDNVGSIAYTYVKRGTSVAIARHSHSLVDDWPPRPRIPRRTFLSATTTALFDVRAPDAFGIQVLGPGYLNRLPVTASYEQQAIDDVVALEHQDLAAWFGDGFPRWPRKPGPGFDQLVPTVLQSAREELAGILVRRDDVAGFR
jgi:hypothetical protein